MISTLLALSLCLEPAIAQPPAPAVSDSELAAKVKANLKSIRRETLPNGLRVYLLPVPGSPIVTTMMAYKVGACDEDKTATGLSHYLEHLLFKGTDKLVPGDIDRTTQRNGGSNNAYTNEDMTVYHFDFAADRWMIALEMEADRMRNTRIDDKHEFQQEKGAVIAELKRNEDGPWDLEYKKILPLLFTEHSPYSHPVIGQEDHVRGATSEVIRRYYDQWYHPNNASLIIVGGFDAEAAVAKVKQLFGSIPRGELPDRKAWPDLKPRTSTHRAEFDSKFDVPRGLIGFNSCRVGEKDDYVFDVIDGILAGGKTSRLYKKLVEGEEIASAVAAGNNAGRYPGWFGINIELLPGQDRKKAEAITFAELNKLAVEPVSPAELARVKRKILTDYIFRQEDIHALCDTIAKAVTYADLDYVTTFLDRILDVTPEDIQRVARERLGENQSVIVWSLPKAAGAASTPASPPKNRNRYRIATATAPGLSGPDLTQARRTVLPNGLTVITLENRRLPIVVADVFISEIRKREPAGKNGIASLVGDLLSEGTAKRTGDEIATLIENTGGSLGFGSSGGSMKMLTSDAPLGFDLLFECLTTPTFPKEAFERFKAQQLAAIIDAEKRPQVKARRLFAQAVFGETPWGRPAAGRRETVEKLTIEDCKTFHADHFAPNRTTLVVVGDISTDELVKRVTDLTKSWKPVVPPELKLPAFPVPEKPIHTIVSDPQASQTHVMIGHLGITRNNPDYYTLLVMDNVLGTGPGFTDRLSSTLRDRQGLAYTVNASISSTAGEDRGAFMGYIGTFPEKYLWVREGFLKEIERIRNEPATAQEVDDAKRYLLGNLAFKLTTNEDIAGQLLLAERNGLGFGFLSDFRSRVDAVTVKDVQDAAKKYLDPKAIAVIAVGPIDAQGKPLAPPKK